MKILLNIVGVWFMPDPFFVTLKHSTLKHSTPIFLFRMVLNSLFRLVIN